jgi:hypothetical protein
MFYLADETFKQQDKTLDIVFGKPIPASTFDGKKSDREWAKWMENLVHEMANQIPSKK